jgi:hypothetical protein
MPFENFGLSTSDFGFSINNLLYFEIQVTEIR